MNSLTKNIIIGLTFYVLTSCVKLPEVPITNPSTIALNWLLSFTNGIGVLTNPSINEANVDYGVSLAVGDWNNDGIQDMAVGAPLSAHKYSGSGAVLIYYGTATGHTTNDSTPDVRLELFSNTLSSQFGSAVVSTDNNGDGIDDLIVGAEQDDRGPANDNEGAVYFFAGSSSGINTTPYQILDEPNGDNDDGFGTSLAVGDMDGDGYNELVVGTRYGDSSCTNCGQVWIFQGKSDGVYLASDNVRVNNGPATAAAEYFGYSVALFDYDNDTNLDLFVGATREDTGGTDRGAVHVYLGNGTAGSFVVSNTVPSLTIANPVASNSSYFGFSISFGDVDNDGNTDMFVGAPLTDSGPTNSGSVRIFKNIRASTAEDSFINQPDLTAVADVYFGYGSVIADLNGDGANDLIVGSARADDNGYNTGRVDVFYGASTGSWDLQTVDKKYFNYEEKQERVNFNNEFGSATCSGDFNGDGIADLAVGAQMNDDLSGDEGLVYLYYTSSDGSVTNKPDVILSAGGTPTGRRFGGSCIVFDFNSDSYNDLIVGSYYDDAGPGNNSGSFSVFYGSASGVSTSPGLIVLNPANGEDGFGVSLAYGDLNNDGFNDIAVGAYLDDTGGGDRGKVYIYASDNTTGVIDTLNPITFTSGASNSDYLGAGLAILDADGDGNDDLLIGIPLDDTNGTNSGRVAVYTNAGVVNTMVTTAVVSYIENPSGQANTSFGEFLSAVNYSSQTVKDLFVGAPDDDINAGNGGALFIYTGSATGIPVSPSNTYRAIDQVLPTNESLGSSATVLDINQDGTLDLVIGAELDDLTGYNSGSVYILLQ